MSDETMTDATKALAMLVRAHDMRERDYDPSGAWPDMATMEKWFHLQSNGIAKARAALAQAAR